MQRFLKVVRHFLGPQVTASRRDKKPFNSMLGETYELVTEDYRFLAEQVCHHPPQSAFFVEGKGYTINGTLATKS